MRNLTSPTSVKGVLVTEPDAAIVAMPDGRLPKKKKKKKLATLEMVGAYESTETSKSESKRWNFSLFLKIFRR